MWRKQQCIKALKDVHSERPLGMKSACSAIKEISWHWQRTGDGGGGRMDWEFGVSRCKLLCIEWINNKVLWYSTGNYIQYPVVNHNGKEYKRGMCIYV